MRSWKDKEGYTERRAIWLRARLGGVEYFHRKFSRSKGFGNLPQMLEAPWSPNSGISSLETNARRFPEISRHC
jgi:hypothetical protein